MSQLERDRRLPETRGGGAGIDRSRAAALKPRGQAAGSSPVGGPVALPPGSRRDRLRSKPGLGLLYRAAVFLAGLVFIALGGVLAALPGPLTIPPVLIGLWIWSTEFRWAKKLFTAFGRKAEEAWTHAKAHPGSSALITVGGLALAAGVFWAIGHYELIDKARDAVGV